ncbi:LRIG1 protein, partial [Polyodon spathula]|nr:LRIG1 protein [Polyodon spathula]
MSNTLGTERAHSQLIVQRASGCVVSRRDGTVTVGIIIIAVVCSIVITSLVWVCIIYQTRKKSEEYSVTNTDETIVPPDVPSYLSSQGTLSDRQEVCISVEASKGPQPNGHIESNGTNICSIFVICTADFMLLVMSKMFESNLFPCGKEFYIYLTMYPIVKKLG